MAPPPTSTTCLVAGSGPDFCKEFEAALRIAPDAEVMAVNLTGLWVPRATWLVSLHPELLGPLRDLRPHADWCKQGKTPPITVSFRAVPGVDRVVEKPAAGIAGTSSLFAVRVALGLGYARIILCGIPMDGTGRFFDPPLSPPLFTPIQWPHHADRAPWEIAAKTEFAGRVRSMGGWTKELLGEP